MTGFHGLRDDLALAAFAVAHGFALQTDRMGERGERIMPRHFDARGIPHDGLQFVLGRWSVWSTDRGWRVARETDGRFPRPEPGDFHAKLFDALETAIDAHAVEPTDFSGGRVLVEYGGGGWSVTQETRGACYPLDHFRRKLHAMAFARRVASERSAVLFVAD